MVQKEKQASPLIVSNQATAAMITESKLSYMEKGKLADFDAFPIWQKLAICQKIEKQFIKRRKIGAVQVAYLPHQTAEKILNFIFNFRVSNEVLNTESVEKTSKKGYTDQNGDTKYKDQKIYDAKATVKFTFTYLDGSQIIRTVLATHKMYDNVAISQYACEQSAVSKSWTIVARTFGIGSELEEREDQSYQRAEKRTPSPAAASSVQAPY